MKTLFLLGVLTVTVYVSCDPAKKYRFDYDWSEQAGGWLKYHAVPSVWDEARLRCHAEGSKSMASLTTAGGGWLGAVLASPITDQLKVATVAFVKKHRDCDDEQGNTIFTGVHATFSKGDYSSIEGVPLLRLAITWAPAEPDNYDNSESCLAMMIGHNGTMADTRCDRVLPYVCYKKDAQLIFTECGTTDIAYHKEVRTGSCYKYHKIGLPWSEAYMTCAAEGGHLVVINNDAEARIVLDIISKNPEKENFASQPEHTLVGFHDWGHYGTSFMTIHGESLSVNYHNWANGEPSNSSWARTGDVGEFCGAVWRNALMNDYLCHFRTAFICEKMPNSLV